MEKTLVEPVEPKDMYLFRRFNLPDLALRSGRSMAYLASLCDGRQPIRRGFRDRMVVALGIPADVLFGRDPECERGAARSTPPGCTQAPRGSPTPG